MFRYESREMDLSAFQVNATKKNWKRSKFYIFQTDRFNPNRFKGFSRTVVYIGKTQKGAKRISKRLENPKTGIIRFGSNGLPSVPQGLICLSETLRPVMVVVCFFRTQVWTVNRSILRKVAGSILGWCKWMSFPYVCVLNGKKTHRNYSITISSVHRTESKIYKNTLTVCINSTFFVAYIACWKRNTQLNTQGGYLQNVHTVDYVNFKNAKNYKNLID